MKGVLMAGAKNPNKALVVGISKYAPRFNDLPLVAADVREISKLLESPKGSFSKVGVEVLTDDKATRAKILAAAKTAFTKSANDQTTFVYLAGHGHVEGSHYYFVASDSVRGQLATTGVPLKEIKAMFDACQSESVFLWLDCCRSGGVFRDATAPSDKAVLARELKVVRGSGKVIIAACAEDQFAIEDPAVGHGLFTHALLEGLRGKAEYLGEVTATSLFDYIDHQLNNPDQRPMLFCESRGRIVLMHNPKAAAKPVRATAGTSSTKAKGGSSNVGNSGNWVMIGEQFFNAKKVEHRPDGNIVVEVTTKDAEGDAAVRRLKPGQYGGPAVPYAHRNDACDATVKNVSSESTSAGHTWKVELHPSESNHHYHEIGSYQEGNRTYTADDISRMRARFILLDEKPAVARGGGFGDYSLVRSTVTQVDKIALSPISKAFKSGPPQSWRQRARLAAIYSLKMAGVVQDVLDLSIGAAKGGKVAVKFRGRCRRRASNVDPVEIEVSGECKVA
jgi:uncharacterized caspase-like protein